MAVFSPLLRKYRFRLIQKNSSGLYLGTPLESAANPLGTLLYMGATISCCSAVLDGQHLTTSVPGAMARIKLFLSPGGAGLTC